MSLSLSLSQSLSPDLYLSFTVGQKQRRKKRKQTQQQKTTQRQSSNRQNHDNRNDKQTTPTTWTTIEATTPRPRDRQQYYRLQFYTTDCHSIQKSKIRCYRKKRVLCVLRNALLQLPHTILLSTRCNFHSLPNNTHLPASQRSWCTLGIV